MAPHRCSLLPRSCRRRKNLHSPIHRDHRHMDSRKVRRSPVALRTPSHARWECLPLTGFPFWTAFQRFDSPGHVEVNDCVKLSPESCIEIMTRSFGFWPVYNADRSLQQGFWHFDKAALTIIQNQKPLRNADFVKQPFVTVRQTRADTLSFRRAVPIGCSSNRTRISTETDQNGL